MVTDNANPQTIDSLHLESTGALAGTFQRSVREIERAAASVGVRPVLHLDRVPFFDSAGAELIGAALRSGGLR